MKKVLSLLLVVMMTVSMVATTAFAANGNFTFSLDKTEYAAGDTVVVTVNSLEKTITTEGFNVKYDPAKVDFSVIKTDGYEIFEPGDICLDYDYNGRTRQAYFEIAENNTTQYQVALGFGSTTDRKYFEREALVTIEFIVKDGASGDLIFTLNENSGGIDGYVGVVDTKTATVKGNEPPAPVVPDEPTVEAPSTVEKSKTWNVVIDGGYVTANDTLTATLYDTTNEADKQDVVLSIGEGVWGEAGWSFSLKANFNDENKMADIGLKVAKN